MKKAIIIFLFMMFGLPGYTQVTAGVWDAKTATYTNKQHKISWTLMEGLNWIGRPITSKGTLLKVKSEELNTLITLNAEPIQQTSNDSFDVWNEIGMYESEDYVKLSRAEAKRLGLELKSHKAIRSQLCGRHANKVTIDMSKYFPEYKKNGHSITYIYQVASDKYIYSLQVWGILVSEDQLADYEKFANLIMNGFSFN